MVWVRPPKLSVETGWRCTGAWAGCGWGPEVKPYFGRGGAAGTTIAIREGTGPRPADGVSQRRGRKITGQRSVGGRKERSVDTGLELERGRHTRCCRRH